MTSLAQTYSSPRIDIRVDAWKERKMTTQQVFFLGFATSILVFVIGSVLIGQRWKPLRDPPWYVGLVLLVAGVTTLLLVKTLGLGGTETPGQALFTGFMVIPNVALLLFGLVLLVTTIIKRITARKYK